MVHLSSVLFLCTGNSARSQLAEALFRHMVGPEFEVYSAGTAPKSIDKRVYEVLESQGVPAGNLVSKTVEELSLKTFDFVITLCDHAKNECAEYPSSMALVHWDLEDPRLQEGSEPFYKTYIELEERIRLFLKLNSDSNQNSFKAPTDLFKVMSDNTRLRILMMIEDEQELCVSELAESLQEIQPKISRHLAQMRTMKILNIRRQAQMIYYRLSDELPVWAKTVLATARNGNPGFINDEKIRLKAMNRAR